MEVNERALEIAVKSMVGNTGIHSMQIFGGDVSLREKFMNLALARYGKLAKGQPLVVYLKDFDIAKNKKFPEDEKTQYARELFISGYLEKFVDLEIVKKHRDIVTVENETKLLDSFDYSDEKATSWHELESMLESDVAIYSEVINRFSETGQTGDFTFDMIKMSDFFIRSPFESVQRHLGTGLYCICFDADHISIDVAKGLNSNFFSKRIGGVTSFCALLDDSSNYPSYYDTRGNIIQNVHDYRYSDVNSFVRK